MNTATDDVEEPMGNHEETITQRQLYEKLATHEDKMNAHEKRFNQIMTIALTTTVPMLAAAFIWIWSTHSAQAAFNAGMRARIDSTAQTYQEARNAQQRVEIRLDEINRFLREDSRELRDQLNAHIRESKER